MSFLFGSQRRRKTARSTSPAVVRVLPTHTTTSSTSASTTNTPSTPQGYSGRSTIRSRITTKFSSNVRSTTNDHHQYEGMVSGDQTVGFSSPSTSAASQQTPSSVSRLESTAQGFTASSPILPPQHSSRRRPQSPSRQPHNHHYSGGGTSLGSNTCNSFLLGGSYYPGKDKKRRVHLAQRQRWWFRIFCSSPPRIMATTLLLAYGIVWYVILPTSRFIVSQWGARWSSPSTILRGNDLLRGVSENQLIGAHSGLKSLLRQHDLVVERLIQKQQIIQQQKSKSQSWIQLLDRIDHSEHFVRRDIPLLVQSRQDELARDSDATKKDAPTAKHGTKIRSLLNANEFRDLSKCPSKLNPNHLQTTLVMQATMDRLWILEEICKRWKDPIIVVVALNDTESNRIMSDRESACPQLRIIPYTFSKDESSQPELYPVNVLRNMALDEVQTSHVLVADVDFVPSVNLDETIKSSLRERQQLREEGPEIIPADEQEAWIIPAFDRMLSPPCVSDEDCRTHLQRDSAFLPRTFQELVACYEAKECVVFQSTSNPAGHSSTPSQEWLEQRWYDDAKSMHLDTGTILRSPRSVDCFDSLRYEPYVLIRWCPSDDERSKPYPVAPYYDERFHGYGKNKIEHVQHLRMMGYRFIVLPEGFIVHNPHVDSKSKQRWNDMEQSELHREMDQLYMQFLQELVDKYFDRIQAGIVEPCSKDKPQ